MATIEAGDFSRARLLADIQDDGGVTGGKSKTQMVQGKNRKKKISMEIIGSDSCKLPSVSYTYYSPQGL